MKKVRKGLFWGIVFGLFFLTRTNSVSAVENCQGISVSQPFFTEPVSVIISHFSGQHIKIGTNYKVQIKGGNPERIDSQNVENGRLISVPYTFSKPGEYTIILELQNKNDVCKGTIKIDYPSDCEWTSNPSTNIVTGISNITLKTANFLSSQSSLDIKVVDPNGDHVARTCGVNHANSTCSFSNNFKMPGRYVFTFTPAYSGVDKRSCSAEFFVGDATNPGSGIIRQVSGKPVDTKKICGSNQNCEDCFGLNDTWTALGCIPTSDLNSFASWVITRFIFIASGTAFLLMSFGAFQIITSSGDPKKTQAGKEVITSAVSGLLIIILSVFLLKLIGVDILKIPGF